MPNYQDQDKFQGTIMHSKMFKDSNMFQGKKVLVVGNNFNRILKIWKVVEIQLVILQWKLHGSEKVPTSVSEEVCSLFNTYLTTLGYWFLPRYINFCFIVSSL